MVGLGEFRGVVSGPGGVEAGQWRNVGPVIDGFRRRPAAFRGIVSPDRLAATGMAVWDSTGFHQDGKPYDRPGRAPVALARTPLGADSIGQHTPFSLFRRGPGHAFGRKG